MAEIGNWGRAISFEVSANRQLPFKDMRRTASGRWKDHNVLGGKPLSEYAGPSLSDVSLQVVLSVERGIKVYDTLTELEKAAEKGVAEYLVIGGKIISGNKMKLESVSETWDEVWNDGALIKATVTLNFTEYVEVSNLVDYDPSEEVVIPWEYAVGDEVTFNGDPANTDGFAYYYKNNKDPKKIKYNKKGYRTDMVRSYPGQPAKVTKYQEGKAHPWYVKSTDKAKAKKGTKKVAGWVDDGWFV